MGQLIHLPMCEEETEKDYDFILKSTIDPLSNTTDLTGPLQSILTSWSRLTAIQISFMGTI